MAKFTKGQTLAIKNAIAKELDPYHDESDKEAWKGADIETREAISRLCKKLVKILS